MITDIFMFRHPNIAWSEITDVEERILHQMITLIFDVAKKNVPEAVEKISSIAYQVVCKEIGTDDLVDRLPNPYFASVLPYPEACRKFIIDGWFPSYDETMKKKVSLIEILCQGLEASLKKRGKTRIWEETSDELNHRLQRASFPFRYHGGMFHKASDELTQKHIEEPFWSVLADAKWTNVDKDIKESLEIRDKQGRDPAFFAAKALESTIKIISDDKGWTHGNEKGAHNYIDNLRSERADRFINDWEAELLKSFFKHVRNPFGHGAGSATMPQLSPQQTDWAIEFSMIWVKSLIRRL